MYSARAREIRLHYNRVTLLHNNVYNIISVLRRPTECYDTIQDS